MEQFWQMLESFPDLAPGIIIGTLTGVAIGSYKDLKAGEMGHWWQMGGTGLVLGAFAWYCILILS